MTQEFVHKKLYGDKPAEQYTGKELDESTGLYYYGARFFDPTFAMWLAPDPANQYLNPYGFGGDPVNAVDPDGRWSWKKTLGIAALDVISGGALSSTAGAIASSAVESGYDWHVASDFFTGGYFLEYTGNSLGLLNASIGGNMDWYEGNVVYSGAGAKAFMPLGGCAFFGHSIFVDERDYEYLIAHELTHARQMDRRGFRLGFVLSYLWDGSLSPSGDDYYSSAYETEAYYFQSLYEEGYVDIYGRIKDGFEDHEKWSYDFYNKSKETNSGERHQPYRNKRGVKKRYGDTWTWEEDWSFYETP